MQCNAMNTDIHFEKDGPKDKDNTIQTCMDKYCKKAMFLSIKLVKKVYEVLEMWQSKRTNRLPYAYKWIYMNIFHA